MLGLARKRPLDALRLLRSGTVRQIDVGEVLLAGDRRVVFVNVASTGFDAEVTRTASAMRTRVGGTAKYVVALLRTLRRFDPIEFELETDDGRRAVRAMLLAIGNGPSYGGGMRVAPGARPDDGRFEVCIVRGMARAEFVAKFPRVYRGTHVRHPKVETFAVRRLRVASPAPDVPVVADGEVIGTLPASFEIRPAALRVLAP
jgi:diacylglycerol kinase (ATP)